MGDVLLRSALHSKHMAMEATLADEAGWLMPMSYRGVLEECGVARSRAAVWDLSHVGRLRIRGDGALALLERVCACDVAHQEDDTVAVAILCNDAGGIIDLCRLVRLEDCWLMLTSPVNRLKVLGHLQGMAEGLEAKIDDQTEKTTLICVAGPAAPTILNAILPEKVSQLPVGAARTGSFMVARYMAMRTGWTGLWSLAVILPNMIAPMAWRFITEKAGDSAVAPAGLAAADVLRIEAALPRYGHELNETIDPVMAGLESVVDWSRDFLGADAIRRARSRGPSRRLAGIILDAAGLDQKPSIPRQGATVFRADGSEAGAITSGTFSPTLDRPIALAYLATDLAEGQHAIVIESAGLRLSGKTVNLPFCP